MIDIRKIRSVIGLTIVFIIYVITVLCFTILQRPLGLHTVQSELFWSYKAALNGDIDLGREILANIAMFMPFGFLSSGLLHTCGQLNKRLVVITMAVGMLASLTIELLQLIFMRGLFEWDDVVSNTCGVIIGIIVFNLLLRAKGNCFFIRFFSCATVVICAIVILTGHVLTDVEADITPRIFWFQVDDVQWSDNAISLEGTAFRYDHEREEPTIILQSTTMGKKIRLESLKAEASNFSDYFGVGIHGFTAEGTNITIDEYEVMVKWPWTVPLSTGSYVCSDGLHYYPSNELVEPKGGAALNEILVGADLRVYRPDYHCWVYQKDWALYWIVDQDFDFEEDGSTYIQYQLWTTETDKLPQKRLENNWLWDNIGSCFEDYELKGDFGLYRVMKRELPNEYPVTAIETGYYKDGAWVWKHYFRPMMSN